MDAETISTITRCRASVARRVAEAWDSYPLRGHEDFEALGLTPRQAASLEAAATAFRAADAPRGAAVRDPSGAFAQAREHLDPCCWTQEVFFALHLDTRQKIIRYQEVARGSLAQVDVHPRELFRRAVVLGAHSIVIGHTHPSGECEPSDADISMTHRMVKVGKLVGIPVLDHIILTEQSGVSLATLGLVPG